MKVLGLDLGANSIGWSLVEDDKIVAAGVRVFPEGVDNFDTKKEKPKMEARRIARGMRRQIKRRARRKRKLRALLTQAGLLPTDSEALKTLAETDPYALRCKAISEQLSLHEFGRLLVHLNQRRGFKSNRKSDRGRKSDDKGLLGEISQLADDIEACGAKTLGAYLAKIHDDPHARIRNRHTRRDMFETEFAICWDKQREFHSKALTDELRQQVHRLIFFQRKMYWPKDVVGRCELEPKLPRAPRADRLAQRFRLLQEVNNLRYYDPQQRDEFTLSAEQRILLLDKLSQKTEMTFDQIRKALGFLDTIKFNLERGERKRMWGMPVDAMLADKKLFGSDWYRKKDSDRNEIVRQIIDAEDEELQKLGERWGLSSERAESLLSLDLPAGYSQLSRVALGKLLPHMERGLLYMTDDNTPSALVAAGYLRPDQRPRKVLEQLPEPPDISNPVVRQALHEVRKVVNAIIREYGKPSRIHLELARNATMSGEERQKASKRRQENEDRRNTAAELIRAEGIKVSRDGIDRVLLWQEQGEICIYSGKPISITQLLQGEVDIDHILPYSKCLDDSMQNKVVAFRKFNSEKGNRTPWDWLGEADPDRLRQILQRAERLNYAKRRRFTQKELDLDHFVERQLNDTRYLSRAASEYLRNLVEEPHHVLCPKGNQTAEFRRHWGLNTVLRLDGEDAKNRDDHRHHAVDAVVLALTDQKQLQQLARIERQGGTKTTGEVLPEPWKDFRNDVEKVVNEINVSHRVQRRVSGALHEDTNYGPTKEPGVFVVRKALESLTPAMIDDIRDDTIRGIVQNRLNERGIKYGDAADGNIPKDAWNPPLTMKSGVPIRKVRIRKRDQTIQQIRGESGHATFVKPGSTHHLCVFEFIDKGKPQREAVFVTMLEAINRIKRHEAIVSRVHPNRPDAKFIISLSRNEMLLATFKGKQRLVRFKTAASTTQQMIFVEHTDARRDSGDNPAEKFSAKPNSLDKNARKVTVDPLGRIRWAND